MRLHATGKKVVRTFLSDSSPQGNENWQLTEYWTIHDATRVAMLVDRLAKDMEIFSLFRPELAEEQGNPLDELLEHNAKCSREVDALIRHHMLPPTGLGFRRQ